MKKTANNLFKILFGLFILILPWQSRWIFFYWYLDEQVWEYGKLGLYGSMLVLLLAALFFILRHKQERYFSKHKFLYVIFGYSILIGFLSPAPLVSFYYLLLVYFAVLFGHLSRFLSKDYILKMFLVSGLLQGLLAVKQSISQVVVGSKWFGIADQIPSVLGTSVVEINGDRILRAFGALPHPNILGGFLFVTAFIGVYLWIQFYKKAEKKHWSMKFVKANSLEFLFILVSLVVITFGMLASFSRSAVLALVVSLFSVAVINIFRRNWLIVNIVIKYALLFLIVTLSFNVWFQGAWTARLQVDGRLEEQSIEKRVGTFSQYYNSNAKDILFGQGIGMNSKLTHEKNPDEPVYNAQPIHNIFVLALAEVGIFGILILLNIVRLVIKEADKIDIMSTSLLLGLVVIGLFDHYLWTTWTGWLLMIFGLMMLYKEKR